jgi:hypothetical protein
LRELSLHILDIVENSIAANASVVRMLIHENTTANFLKIKIRDNGRGIPQHTLPQATNPFFSTRSTRKIGLGLSLLEHMAQLCSGWMELISTPENGTSVTAVFMRNHIDRPPLGDMASTLTTLMTWDRKVDFIYHHVVNRNHFTLNTRLLRSEMNLADPAVLAELGAIIRNHLTTLNRTLPVERTLPWRN